LKTIKNIDTVVAKVLEIFCISCVIALFVIMIAKVFFRLVPVLSLIPTFSTGWFDEIIEWLFAWLIMTCSTLLCRNNEHFRVDLISTRLKNQNMASLLDTLCYTVALIFYVLLFHYSLLLCHSAVQTTPILGWPKSWFYMCVPVNSALMCIYTVARITIYSKGILAKKQTI